MLRSGEGAA